MFSYAGALGDLWSLRDHSSLSNPFFKKISFKFMRGFLHPAKQWKEPEKWDLVGMKGFSSTSTMGIKWSCVTKMPQVPHVQIKKCHLWAAANHPCLSWSEEHQGWKILQEWPECVKHLRHLFSLFFIACTVYIFQLFWRFSTVFYKIKFKPFRIAADFVILAENVLICKYFRDSLNSYKICSKYRW